MSGQKSINRPKRNQIIKCECGAEILMLPDVKEMSKAIEHHIHEHCHSLTGLAAKDESERLWEQLVAILLQKASYTPKPVL